MARTSRTAAALLLLAIAFGRATAAPQASTGSSCVLKSGGAGTCRPLADCPAAKGDKAPVVCASSGSSYGSTVSGSLVCCPPEPAPGVRAAKMCEKYAQYGRLDPCLMNNEPLENPNGEAKHHEFPHMALLGDRKETRRKLKWKCCGSLISERYVLTAAQCLTGSNSENLTLARMGGYNDNEDEEGTNAQEDFGIEKIIPHPDYTPGKLDYNVGLVKLDRDVNFTRFHRPACLYTFPKVPNRNATVTGWAVIGDYNPWAILKKYSVNLLRPEECDAVDDKNTICAKSLKTRPGQAYCLGDAGGPMQTQHRSHYCMYEVIGITNVDDCNDSQNPFVMPRVSHFVPWIESIVWSD